jgi:predicted  nucleic acid-binding Zn-ribbon protein
MPKSLPVRAALSLAVSLASLSFLTACEDAQRRADRDVQSQVDVADQAGAKATTLDDLDDVQRSLDSLASQPGLSTEMQIIVRGRQAQLRYQRILLMMSDLGNQEQAASRSIDDINQLAAQVASCEASMDAVKSYDPSFQSETLKGQEAQLQGAADKLTWTAAVPGTTPGAAAPDASADSPTLFAINAEIDSLTGKIADVNQKIDAAKKESGAQRDQAENLTRASEGKTGNDQLNAMTAASEAQRKSELADASVFALQNTMTNLQADLARAQDQKTAMTDAVGSFDAQIQALQTRWANLQQQNQAQQDLIKRLIGDPSDKSVASISQRAGDLSSQLKSIGDLRDKVNTELTSVITQFGQAASLASQLRTDTMTEIGDHPNDPDVIIWKQKQETLHPGNYSLQEAAAKAALASVAANKTHLDLAIARMFDGYTVSSEQAAAKLRALNLPPGKEIKIAGLSDLLDRSKTGVDIPAAFADLGKISREDLKLEIADVKKDFDDALQSYEERFGATDSGPSAAERKNVSLTGSAAAHQEYAHFLYEVGDAPAAREQSNAANDDLAQVDPTFQALATAATAQPAPPAQPGANSGAASGSAPEAPQTPPPNFNPQQ